MAPGKGRRWRGRFGWGKSAHPLGSIETHSAKYWHYWGRTTPPTYFVFVFVVAGADINANALTAPAPHQSLTKAPLAFKL